LRASFDFGNVTAAPAPPDSNGNPSNATRILGAGIAVFTLLTGALLVFGHNRGGALAPFARVGRNVARDVSLSQAGDAAVGLVVHLGQSLALGALAVLLLSVLRPPSRLRAALIVVLVWQLAALVPWFAVIRPESSVSLTPLARALMAVLLVVAVVVGTGRRDDAKT
jgi:hypothetical protein